MTLKFIVSISNTVRSFSLKVKSSSFKRTIEGPLKTVLAKSTIAGVAGARKFDKRSLGKTRVQHFHVTNPNKALPPLFVLLSKYIGRVGAAVSGRLIRKWWLRLSPEKKEKIWAKIHSKKSKIAFAGTILMGGAYLYYLENIVEVPITKRRRFLVLNQKQLYQLADFEYNRLTEEYKSAILPNSHPVYKRVARVANILIVSNSDLKEIRDKEWGVTVIDIPEITNAFVYPNGRIFVFSGMLNVCNNDDQLAIILAHEISHTILSHNAEIYSKVFLMQSILFIPSLFLWIIFPDAWAFFSEGILSALANIFIHLPFSRALEKEADVVGLQLAAKSCFDVREAPIFWAKMKVVSSAPPIVEWLSTHPAHETRQLELQELVPEALHIRDMNKCPSLIAKPHFVK